MEIIKTIMFDHCFVFKATYKGGFHMNPHTDEVSKISVVLDGCLHERTTGNYVAAGKGSVVIKPNHIIHEDLFGLKGATILSLCFKKDYPLPAFLKNWDWIEHPKIAFLALRLWYALKSSKNDKQLGLHLDQFTKAMQACKKAHSPGNPAWVEMARTSLDSGDRTLNRITSLSKNINSHRVHISRSFKKYYSLSPVAYRNFVRLKQLLLSISDPYKSLASIAYDCGFSDQSHMARIVRKETGFTAKELKKTAQIN